MLAEGKEIDRFRRSPKLADSLSIYRAKTIESGISQLPFIKGRMILDSALTFDDWPKDFEAQIRVLSSQILALERSTKKLSVGREYFIVAWHPDSISNDSQYEKYFASFDKDGVESFSDLIDLKCNGGLSYEKLTPRQRFIIKCQCLTGTGIAVLQSYWLQANEAFIMKVASRIAERVKPEAWGGTATSVID